MPIDAAYLINSRLTLGLASITGQLAPAWLARAIAGGLAAMLASQRQLKLVRSVRANQWVVSGETLRGKDLDRAVVQVFRRVASGALDLYYFDRHGSAAEERIDFEVLRQLEDTRRRSGAQRGLILAGFHFAGFDLVTQALSRRGLRALWLSLPRPKGGYRMQLEMRRRSGMHMIPVNIPALKQAARYLDAGGIVITGIDRPFPTANPRPRFFGRPSLLTTTHVRLALQANVPVRVLAPGYFTDGRYHSLLSEPIEMVRQVDKEQELLLNAERILALGETMLRGRGPQWAITLPVWPEAISEVPD